MKFREDLKYAIQEDFGKKQYDICGEVILPVMYEDKEITGYFVSDKGRIFTLSENGEYIPCKISGTKKSGLRVRMPDLNDLSTLKYYQVSKVMGYTFLIKLKNEEVVNHMDSNPFNNDLDNLEWCSYRDKAHHSWASGVNAKAVYQIDIKTGERLNHFRSYTEASKITGIPWNEIQRAATGITETAGGYRWEPAPKIITTMSAKKPKQYKVGADW